jgi:hypothetical protein
VSREVHRMRVKPMPVEEPSGRRRIEATRVVHPLASTRPLKFYATMRGVTAARPSTRGALAIVPEGLGAQVPGDPKLARHQGGPRQEPFDHRQRLVLNLIRVECRLLRVSQEVADAAAK